MCPFPIYPLYTRTVILSLDKPIADCFLFRPRKSCEKRRKRSHTNVSNTLSTRSSTPPAQTPHVRFGGLRRVHTCLRQQDRTQRHTRRNRGLPDGAAITTLGAFHTFRKPCVARCQNGVLCRFGVLVGDAPEERRKPSEQRCAYARRCSEGVAAPLGCVIFSVSVEIYGFTPRAQGFLYVRGGDGITTLSALYVLLKRRTAACQKGSFAAF